MNIGEAASQTGLPAKTIRYYEDIDLVRPARRNNGFRDYCDRDIHDLRFVAQARGLASDTGKRTRITTTRRTRSVTR